MIKLYKIIFFLNLLLFTFSVQGYELPNYRNNSIVLSFGDDLWGKVVENKNYIPKKINIPPVNGIFIFEANFWCLSPVILMKMFFFIN